MRTAQALRTEIARLQKQLTTLEAFGEDDYETGAVISFSRNFNGGSRFYAYAAIKGSDGLWYTTGPKSNTGYTWDGLCSFMAEAVGGVWHATEWEAITDE